MKSLKIAAALGLMIAGAGISTAATAQHYDGDHRGYDRHDDRRDWRDDRGNHGGWRDGRRGYYGHDRGYGYGGGYGYHHGGWRGGRDCRTTWRYHRRVTVCYR